MKNEKTFDDIVRDEVKKLVGNDFSEQGSINDELKKSLKNASKSGGTGTGKPEFIFIYENTVFVIEDKHSRDFLEKLSADGQIDLNAIKGGAPEKFAVNGAVHYAKNIISKSTYKEVVAIGATPTFGDNVILRPYWVGERDSELELKKLNDLTSFDDLKENFDEWYQVEVLGEDFQSVKENERIQNLAANIHEDLRNYGALGDEEKPLVISAILLALFNNPKLVENFNSRRTRPKRDKDGNIISDGKQIYDEVEGYFNNILGERKNREIRSDLAEKFDVVKSRFQFIANNKSINTVNPSIDKTPISFYTEKIAQGNLTDKFQRTDTDFDVLGHFYEEFVSYGGKDSANLGIVLTPAHITKLMADLIDVKYTDVVLDPTCGSGGFLVAAMNRMLNKGSNDDYTLTQEEVNAVKRDKLYGIELSEKLFVVAVTNMILRGDGKSNLKFGNMFDFSKDSFPKPITKVLMNPPYSQGTKANPDLYEINFIKHALEMMDKSLNNKLAVIVPQSTFTSDSRGDKLGTKDKIKEEILKNNTLEAVITLNKDTFNGTAGVHPVVAIFNSGKGQGNTPAKFFDFRNDGYSIWKHKGQLKDDGTALEKRQHLKYVFENGLETNMTLPHTSFMVQSPIKANDEWLHSYFYFNDEIPKAEDFAKTVQDYLAFKFDQTVHGRGYLFENEEKSSKK